MGRLKLCKLCSGIKRKVCNDSLVLSWKTLIEIRGKTRIRECCVFWVIVAKVENFWSKHRKTKLWRKCRLSARSRMKTLSNMTIYWLNTTETLNSIPPINHEILRKNYKENWASTPCISLIINFWINLVESHYFHVGTLYFRDSLYTISLYLE